MNIERLLWIAEVYVLNVEENHQTTRIILPHGASFHGLQINLMITCESPKQEFMLLVSILCCTSKWHSVDGKFIILCLIIKVEALYVQYRYVSNVANWKLITQCVYWVSLLTEIIFILTKPFPSVTVPWERDSVNM